MTLLTHSITNQQLKSSQVDIVLSLEIEASEGQANHKKYDEKIHHIISQLDEFMQNLYIKPHKPPRGTSNVVKFSNPTETPQPAEQPPDTSYYVVVKNHWNNDNIPMAVYKNKDDAEKIKRTFEDQLTGVYREDYHFSIQEITNPSF